MDYAEQTPRQLALVRRRARGGPRALKRQVYRLGPQRANPRRRAHGRQPRIDFHQRAALARARQMLRTQSPWRACRRSDSKSVRLIPPPHAPQHHQDWPATRPPAQGVDVLRAITAWRCSTTASTGTKIKAGGQGGAPVIDLNLLRSAPYPGAQVVSEEDLVEGEPNDIYTDQADHAFTYALYPHLGDHVAGGVIQAGYALNVPLRAVALDPAQTGDLPAQRSFLELSAPNIVIEAVKQAEDSNALIVRLYEAANRRTQSPALRLPGRRRRDRQPAGGESRARGGGERHAHPHLPPLRDQDVEDRVKLDLSLPGS